MSSAARGSGRPADVVAGRWTATVRSFARRMAVGDWLWTAAVRSCARHAPAERASSTAA